VSRNLALFWLLKSNRIDGKLDQKSSPQTNQKINRFLDRCWPHFLLHLGGQFGPMLAIFSAPKRWEPPILCPPCFGALAPGRESDLPGGSPKPSWGPPGTLRGLPGTLVDSPGHPFYFDLGDHLAQSWLPKSTIICQQLD